MTNGNFTLGKRDDRVFRFQFEIGGIMSVGSQHVSNVRPRPALTIMAVVVVVGLMAAGAVRGRPPATQPAGGGSILRDMDFSAVSIEYDVSDLKQSIAFFEKLGFTKKWENAGAGGAGDKPRAGLVGGNARIWLRQGGGQIQPGAGEAHVRFWIEGGRAALERYREAIQVRGVTVIESHEDETLAMFSVATPDGQRVGFFALSR